MFDRRFRRLFQLGCALRRNTNITVMENKGNESTVPGECQFIKEEIVASGKWICLKKITYRDINGKERFWESAARTTRQSEDSADAVSVVAVLKRRLRPSCIICIKQYRPPLKSYTLEFPAGLIDAGESAEDAALRELKEETGYVATIKSVSPIVALDPGSENCTMNIITAEVDGEASVNQKPEQQQEETEFIEVLKVPMDEMLQKLDELSAEGLVVDSRVYSYAQALSHVASGLFSSDTAPRPKDDHEDLNKKPACEPLQV